MTLARAAPIAALGLALIGLAPAPASAAEGEALFAVGAGFATARADGRWAPGGGLDIKGQYGLDDAWSVGAGISASWHPVDADAVRPGGRVRALAFAASVT